MILGTAFLRNVYAFFDVSVLQKFKMVQGTR